MSKSLGNFFTLRDLLARGFAGREVRNLLLQAHYRETFNFTLEGLQSARMSLARIAECLSKLREFWDDTVGPIPVSPDPRDVALLQEFERALDDDLNVSKAWGAVFEWIRELNRTMSEGKLSKDQAASARYTWEKKLDPVLGLNLDVKSPFRMREERGVVGSGLLVNVRGEEDVPDEVKRLLMQRTQARSAKDFKRADQLRDELRAKGWLIEDTPKGEQRVKRA
jgi:cysteinyl-tRNA synthetase